jgi:hypothetical protein
MGFASISVQKGKVRRSKRRVYFCFVKTNVTKKVFLALAATFGVAGLSSLSVFSQTLRLGVVDSSKRSITFGAGTNQACVAADGLASQVYPNTTISGASEGAYVNTALTRYTLSFAYGNEASGTWAVLEGNDGYILLALEIRNPLSVSGHFCLNGSIDTQPSCAFCTGTALHFSTIGNGYSLGSNTSMALQRFNLDVASLGLSKTPSVVLFHFSLKNSVGSTIRMTFDDLTITYAC